MINIPPKAVILFTGSTESGREEDLMQTGEEITQQKRSPMNKQEQDTQHKESIARAEL